MGGPEVSATIEPARFPFLLLDTHALVWLMFGDSRLGKQAHEAIRKSGRADRLLISAITPWEIGVLVAKKRIDLHQDALEWVNTALALPGLRLTPLDPEIAVASTCLPFEIHSDPADRILVATARHLGGTLVTADKALLALAKKGNFRAIDASK
jgi:PIN domain nuclease of toxin-antitoxin system